MSFANDILDAIEIMVKQVVEDNATKIYTGVCKTIGANNCVLTINGKDNTVKYYGGVPVVGTVYQVFIPFGNMSAAFIIVPGSGGGSGGDGVDSVNGKTGDVVLSASDVGAYPNGIKGAVNCDDLSDGTWTISARSTNGPGAFACTLFHKDWNADFASQFAFGADHNVYYRVKTGGSWLAWQEMYSTLRYPSPAKIGAVAKSGDTMTGALTVQSATYPDINLKNTGSGSNTKIRNTAHRTQIMSQEDDNNYRALVLNDKSVTTVPANILQIMQVEDGSQTAAYQVYHTGNKPTFNDLAYFGNVPIASTDDDTTANWQTLGTGFARYNATGKLIDQPSQYGLLISFAQSDEVFQIWRSQPSGPTYTRSGNKNGWSGSWSKIYDSSNKPTSADIGALQVNPPSIELFPASSTSNHGGFIDFHYNRDASDYTSRIIEGASGQLQIDAPSGVYVRNPPVARNAIRNIQAGTSDLIAGTSSLATGAIYLVYE